MAAKALEGAASAGIESEAEIKDNAKGNGQAKGPTQADLLIQLSAAAKLFHRPDGTGFADIDVNGHRETWPIRSKGFKRWLSYRFYNARQGGPNSEALQTALNVIEAKAHFNGPEQDVFVRVGGHDGRIYLDLGDDKWRAVEIDATGWRIVDEPPVRFRRAAGMRPLPDPVAGGSVGKLRAFLNVQTEANFVLVVSWLLASLRDRGPYPVLVLSGEQGSAKSTFSTIVRALVDPNTAPLRALPREDRDLFIAANNSHVLAFDNVSGLPHWISDTLCRLASGGGFAVRQLYSDQDEVLFELLSAADSQRDRGHCNPSQSRRPCHIPDAGADPRGKAQTGGRAIEGVRSRAPVHPRCSARRYGCRPKASARDPSSQAAPPG